MPSLDSHADVRLTNRTLLAFSTMLEDRTVYGHLLDALALQGVHDNDIEAVAESVVAEIARAPYRGRPSVETAARVHVRLVHRTPAGIGAVRVRGGVFADDDLTCLVGRMVRVQVSPPLGLAVVSLFDGTKVCAASCITGGPVAAAA